MNHYAARSIGGNHRPSVGFCGAQSPQSPPLAYQPALVQTLHDGVQAMMGEAHLDNYHSWLNVTHQPDPNAGAAPTSAQVERVDRIVDLLSNLDELAKPQVYNQLSRIDKEIVHHLVRRNQRPLNDVAPEVYLIWEEAKHQNRYADFQPHLKQIIEDSAAQYAQADPSDTTPIYDRLMQASEPKLTQAVLDPMFQTVAGHLVPFIGRINAIRQQQEQQGLSTFFLSGQYFPKAQQEEMIREMVTRMGFDLARGEIRSSEHPITITIRAPHDVRFTVHYDETNLLDALFAALHEVGHGIHGQQTSPNLADTPLADDAPSALSESQGLFYEYMIGHSKPFAQFLFGLVKKHFPQQTQAMDFDSFYREINRVQPGPIRVLADEVTYLPHILVRYEIEKQLYNGHLTTEELPQAWNKAMAKYLGVIPQSDTQGVLQDVHWAIGDLGYFPNYGVGLLAAAQLMDTAKRQLPGLENDLARGDLRRINQWLKDGIHQWGAMTDLDDSLRRLTGHPLTPAPFIHHIYEKYGELYPGSAPALPQTASMFPGSHSPVSSVV